MLKNYLLIAIRNLTHHRLNSAINIGGLAVGLAACIFIFLFVRYETSFDSWIPEADSIYRLETTNLTPGQPPERLPRSMSLAKAALEKDFPAISGATRIFFSRPNIRRDNLMSAEIVAFVDQNFFDVFDLPMVSGDRVLAVTDNTSLILSERAALKYFGDQDPINQNLLLNGEETYRVVGVMKNFPDNSHMDFEFVALFDPQPNQDRPNLADTWRSTFVYTYLKIENAADAKTIQQSLEAFVARNRPETEEGVTLTPIRFDLVPIQDIHLESPGGYGMSDPVPAKTIYIYSGVAFLILLIAGANYINLAIARTLLRAREIGLRKVLGASRKNLMGQFFIESVLFCICAFTLAFLVVQTFLPWFNVELGKNLVIDPFQDSGLFFGLFGIFGLIVMVTGFYPALYLSSLKSPQALKAKISGKNKKALGHVLVLSQFGITITLLSITFGVFSQHQFSQNFDPGYEDNGVVIIQGMRRADVRDQVPLLVDRLKSVPGVEEASLSLFVPGDNGDFRVPAIRQEELGENEIFLSAVPSDENFFPALGIKVSHGRGFSEDIASDLLSFDNPENISGTVILNQKAAHQLGFGNPEEAINKMVTLRFEEGPARVTIVGVVPDFNLQSLHHDIRPTVFFNDPTRFSKLSLKITRDAGEKTFEEISMVWASIYPEVTLRMEFLSDALGELYKGEEAQTKTFGVFALLGFILACVGLFGLAAFTAAQRTKEIGIRKILGASQLNLVNLLIWGFSKPVFLANVIAWPLAWYFLDDWLSGFVYRVEMSPLYFAGPGFLALVVAWGAVGAQAWKVARANPIKALRYE